MAAVTLERADIAGWWDVAGTRLVIPRLQVLTPSERVETAFVRFEGDEARTGFRGEGRESSFAMTARYLSGEHDQAADLLALFRTAHDEVDGRLLLRTHLGEVAGLNELEAVLVAEWSRAYAGAGVVDVSFTAESVAFSLSV